MSNRIEESISSAGDFSSGDRVLAAVSGGADSMALLCALETCAESLGITLCAAHFDHQLREDSANDREFVESFCKSRGIECFSDTKDVGSLAREHGETIEEAARRHRYGFLEETAQRIDAAWIATGHTRNDQTETILMRVLRGAGVRGLSGIPRRRGRIVRPLLGVPRDDTVAYCREHGVAFVEDPSNRDVRYTRNRIRHEVLPQLRHAFPDVDANLLRLAHNAADALAHVRRDTNPLLNHAAREERDGVWVVDTRAIEHLDELARHVFFADLLVERMDCECDAGRVHYEHLGAMSRPGFPSGHMLSLPGITVRREHETLVFFPGVRHPDEAARTTPRQELECPGNTTLPQGEVEVAIVPNDGSRDLRAPARFRHHSSETGGTQTSAVAYFALESLQLPLVVRSPGPGDRMRPFGMDGHKKLSDIFVDRKIPARERGSVLVVADQEEIMWLVGIATSETARVVPETSSVVQMTVST